MDVVWGVVMIVVGLVAWIGQTVSWLAPDQAVRFGLMEPESAVEPAFWADVRGEAFWDALMLWTMPVAGALLVVDHSAWAHLGLVAGGMYLYFAGRGIATRLAMRRRGLRIGTAENVRVGLAALAVWTATGLATIALAAAAID